MKLIRKLFLFFAITSNIFASSASVYCILFVTFYIEDAAIHIKQDKKRIRAYFKTKDMHANLGFMDDVVYDLLKAGKHKYIGLTLYKPLKEKHNKVLVTIAGVSKPTFVDLEKKVLPNGKFSYVGQVELDMWDYELEPMGDLGIFTLPSTATIDFELDL